MSENPQATPGRIVWHELMSNDVDQSVGFYSKLFDWNIQPVDMGEMGTYNMIHVGDRAIGGFSTKSPEDPSPPHWVAYANVPDVDAAVTKAQEMGGSAPLPGTDIPGVGRFAFIMDPQGGLISAFKGANPEAPEWEGGQAPAGAFCWNELVSTDAESARPFYENLFGWKPQPMDPQNPGKYTFFMRSEDKCEAALMPIPPEVDEPKTAWIPYVAVDSVDAAMAKANELGAKTCMPATDIEGGFGRCGVLQDPSGAFFAVYRPAKKEGE